VQEVAGLLAERKTSQMDTSLSGAIDQLNAVLETHPDDSVALKQLTSLYWRSQQLDKASECLERLLSHEPGNAHVWNSRGICLTALGNLNGAIHCFREAAHIEPSNSSLQQNLGQALLDAGQNAEALEAFKRVVVLEPQSATGKEGLAKARERLPVQDDHESNEILSPEERLSKASSLFSLVQVEEAGQEVDRLLEDGHVTSLALLLKGMVLAMKGWHQEALDFIWKAIELEPDSLQSYFFLMQSLKVDESHRPIVERMENLACSSQAADLDKSKIYFALGNAYDALKEYELAMSRFDQANQYAKKTLQSDFDPHELVKDVDDLIATFDWERLNRRQDYAIDSEVPLLIVGMPRSGTTLTEGILSRHPRVAAAGELRFWSDHVSKAYTSRARAIHAKEAKQVGEEYLRMLQSFGPEADRVIDKNPFNFQRVGLIASILPKARFIHCKRNPVDSCLSFYMTFFNNPPSYSFDKSSIVFYYEQYQRLTEHWKAVLRPDQWLEVQYEELIADQEGGTRRILDFCGLEWSDECLRPQDSERIIGTSSHWQARQPVYRTSVERWRRYEPWLGEFRELLSE
jgi:tetratricopeptide (TPR) repeat protein